MSTKQTGVSCYDKAAEDEPLFVLRAKDPIAPAVITAWVEFANQAGIHQDKTHEALQVAKDMVEWQKQNLPKS